MYLFFLGVILGVGLVLAIRSVQRTLVLRRIRKDEEFNALVQAEVNKRLETSANSWNIPAPPRPSAFVGQGRSNGFQPIRHP